LQEIEARQAGMVNRHYPASAVQVSYNITLVFQEGQAVGNELSAPGTEFDLPWFEEAV
jgi:hypothetical protein